MSKRARESRNINREEDSPNGCNGCGWARAKPVGCNSTLVCHIGESDQLLGLPSAAFSNTCVSWHVSWHCDGECCCRQWWLNPLHHMLVPDSHFEALLFFFLILKPLYQQHLMQLFLHSVLNAFPSWFLGHTALGPYPCSFPVCSTDSPLSPSPSPNTA